MIKKLNSVFSHKGVFLNVAFSLQLEGLSTKKPRITKYTLKPTVSSVSIASYFEIKAKL